MDGGICDSCFCTVPCGYFFIQVIFLVVVSGILSIALFFGPVNIGFRYIDFHTFIAVGSLYYMGLNSLSFAAITRIFAYQNWRNTEVQIDDRQGRFRRSIPSGKDATDPVGYVTQKALDGLFMLIADEEAKIRRDPLGRTTSLLRKVFGILR